MKELVYNALKKYAEENNEEAIDWTKKQTKYIIKCDRKYNELFIDFTSRLDQIMNQVYFTSIETARSAMEEIGEDMIKKYLFNIKE